MLYIREDIHTKLLRLDYPGVESFSVEINLYKKKWLNNCSSYNPLKSKINPLNIIRYLPNMNILYFSVILMHTFMMRLSRLFENLTYLIVSLNNPRALKIPRTQAAWSNTNKQTTFFSKEVCYRDRTI